MAFCIKCGQELQPDDAFCPNCGTAVEKDNHSNTQSFAQNATQMQDQAKNTINDIKNTTMDFISNDKTGFLDKFVKQNNVVGIFSCLLIILGCFLPFASVSVFGYSQSVSLMSDGKDGIIFLVASIITIAMILIKKDILALITGIITGGLGIYEIIYTNNQLNSYSSMIDKGMGYYFLMIGAVILIISVLAKKFILK